MQPILIYGSGGHGREVARLVEAMIENGTQWKLVGFIDDDVSRHGSKVHGIPVIGGSQVVAAQPGCFLVAMGIGSPRNRRDAAERLKPFAAGFPALIHPGVSVHRSVDIGSGVQLHEGTIVTVDVTLSDHVVVNRRCDISHDCSLAAYATLAPTVSLAGGVSIGQGADLGIRSTCLPRLSVGEWSIIGAGAVVTRNVSDLTTVVGVPARQVESVKRQQQAA